MLLKNHLKNSRFVGDSYVMKEDLGNRFQKFIYDDTVIYERGSVRLVINKESANEEIPEYTMIASYWDGFSQEKNFENITTKEDYNKNVLQCFKLHKGYFSCQYLLLP